MDSVTPEEGCAARDAIFREYLDKHKITGDYLAKKLKAELNAKETKTFKAKVIKTERPTVGYPVVIETEEVIYSKPMIAWDVRQKARMDANKLRGDYPAEKHEVGGKNGGPIRHEHDIGGAVQTVVDRLIGTILRPPTNGTSG